MQMPRLRSLILSSVFLVLGALIAFAMQRELTARVPTANPTTATTAAQNALTADEEAYAAALWPIHSGVEVSAVEISFAGLDYVTEHPDRERLGERAMKLQAELQGAAAKAADLAVPASMRAVHDEYLEALALYLKASAEMVKVAADGRMDHLVAAQHMSQRAAEDLLKVGDVLWPSEHKPH